MIRNLYYLFIPAALLLTSVVPDIQASPDKLPDISGKFTDREGGRVLVDADLTGYVETDGRVIFDGYFGRVTSTNRLQLSGEGNMLTGSFTNTLGGDGDVTLRRNP